MPNGSDVPHGYCYNMHKTVEYCPVCDGDVHAKLKDSQTRLDRAGITISRLRTALVRIDKYLDVRLGKEADNEFRILIRETLEATP